MTAVSRFAEREVIDRNVTLTTPTRGLFSLTKMGDIENSVESAEQPSGQEVPTGKEKTVEVQCEVQASDSLAVARIKSWYAACKVQARGYKEKGAIVAYQFGDGSIGNTVRLAECWISKVGIGGTEQAATGKPVVFSFTLKVFGAEIMPAPPAL